MQNQASNPRPEPKKARPHWHWGTGNEQATNQSEERTRGMSTTQHTTPRHPYLNNRVRIDAGALLAAIDWQQQAIDARDEIIAEQAAEIARLKEEK